MTCIGCKLANKLLETSVVYEDKWITVLLDIAPFNEGHVLIMPKIHYQSLEEMDESTTSRVTTAAKDISIVLKELYHPDGITLVQNGGYFDELTHFHLHVVPRFKGQKFSEFFDIETEKPTREELELVKEKMVEKLKELAIRKYKGV